MSGPSAVDYLHHVQREERLADKVAELLKKAILSGQLQPGDRLPPERILGERFGVSRTVIREAVRSLAAKGLVEVRSGSGSVVARVEAPAVAETIRLYIQGASIGHDLVDELRRIVEVQAAGLAAERATEADLAELSARLQAMAGVIDEPRERAVQDVEFHRGVAHATRNPLLVVLLDAIVEPLLAIREGTLGLPGRAQRALDAHARILERIAERDGDGAREAMRAHLADSRQVWEEALLAARGNG